MRNAAIPLVIVASLTIASPTAVAAPPPAAAPAPLAEQVAAQVDRAMIYPELSYRRNETGIVHVAFKLDGDGMPVDVRVARKAYWPALNRAAVRTVKTIGPFVGARKGQRLRAVLQYAIFNGEDHRARLAAELGKAGAEEQRHDAGPAS